MALIRCLQRTIENMFLTLHPLTFVLYVKRKQEPKDVKHDQMGHFSLGECEISQVMESRVRAEMFPRSGQAPAFKPLSLRVKAGERVQKSPQLFGRNHSVLFFFFM